MLTPALTANPTEQQPQINSSDRTLCLIQVLAEVTFKEPRIPVYSNVTGKPFETAEEMAGMLQRQLVEPVMWESTMKNLKADGKTSLYECGPGQQLKAMCKRIDLGMWKEFKNISV